MKPGMGHDRRRYRAQGLRFDRSLIFRIPNSISITVLGLAAVLVETADSYSSADVWFGPIYLLIIAISAWTVGRMFALGIGLAILSTNNLSGNNLDYPYGSADLILNAAFKLFCVLSIVLMLGLARTALEREWRLARMDSLTGALNRQAFFEAMKADAGQKGPSVLIFADLDGLKRLNDEKGHEAGDDGLRNFAARVKSAIRNSDLFARIGGDEFVIFMKVRDQAAAVAVANRLNRSLNVDAPLEGSILRCSLGVLFLAEGSQSIDAELNLADELMYAAKRDRIGLLTALAVEVDGTTKLASLLETSRPTEHHSAIRSGVRGSSQDKIHDTGLDDIQAA